MFVALLTTGLGSYGWAQNRAATRSKRARLPKFDAAQAKDVFFDDLFGAQSPLVGTRPAGGSIASAPRGANNDGAGTTSGSSDAATTTAGSGTWSKVISTASIEAEVKALQNQLETDIGKPTSFAGGGHKLCQSDFTVLAMLMGIIGEYDGDVKWKKSAAAARSTFAQTANNCKTGSRQTFDDARKRSGELRDLINGNGFPDKPVEAKTVWPETCIRRPLMVRLEAALHQRLQASTSSKSEFTKDLDGVLREAEVAAAIAEVLMKDAMPNADDSSYMEFARSLQNAARDVANACKAKDDDAARKAVGEMSKACDNCHGSFN